jgi:hypothetical protein
MLFQNLKTIGEELSEICVLFSKYIYIFIYIHVEEPDRFCGLEDRVPCYRSRCPGSIPGAVSFLKINLTATGSTQPREYN